MSDPCDFLAGVRSEGARHKKRYKGEYPELEEIIDIWPNKKIDRGKAKGAWINAVVREELDPQRVLQRAREWCDYWEQDRPKIIPYLGKWLAEGGWEDRVPRTEWEKQYRYEPERAPDYPESSYDRDSPD